MLVCPQCQFENPDTNNFCQRCGTSLTEKVCPACEASVAFDAEHCLQCGERTGTVWRAIVSPVANQSLLELPVTPMTPLPGDSGTIPIIRRFLDGQQRYLLLEEPSSEALEAALEVRVLDCQPLQPSLLEVLYEQQIGTESTNPSDATAIANRLSVPAVAQTYLALQQLNPSLPQIHDAWEQAGQTVILLGDRSELPLLLDLWSSENVLPIQILHWLHEMIEMWAELEPYGCRQSLLELPNLRVDEDYLLCLQRLYFEPSAFEPSAQMLELRDLGRLWQILFQKSQRTQFGALAHLCYDLESGTIASLDELRLRFEAIADEMQSTVPLDITADSSQPEPSTASGLNSLNIPAGNTGAMSTDAAETTVPFDLQLPTIAPRIDFNEAEEDLNSEGDDAPTVVLPMRLVSIEDAGRTDIGRQRTHNEDCFSIQTDVKKLESPQGRSLAAKGLYVLCDGMGGHAGGEVASALAVETLRQYFDQHWQDQLPSADIIRDAIVQTNQAIFNLNQQNARSGSGRMGTTLVLVLIQDTEAAIAHVGDSRLYRFSRRRGLEQVTVDHEVGQREIQRGVEPAIAYARPDAYQLTQALGPRDENFISPDVQFMELNEDLLLLLCSDGLTDNDLLETHWRTHLEPLLNSQVSLEQGVNQLVDLANHYNGHDNITAVAIRTRVRPNLELLKQG
jgi:protein phosphatase